MVNRHNLREEMLRKLEKIELYIKEVRACLSVGEDSRAEEMLKRTARKLRTIYFDFKILNSVLKDERKEQLKLEKEYLENCLQKEN